MADEAPQPIDFWSVLDEAQQTVESWPSWQQRYDADVYADVYAGDHHQPTERAAE